MVKLTGSVAEIILGDVPERQRLWCHDGRHLKNLEELKSALEQMSDDTYRYHTNEFRTDFSNWVKDVIGDEKLSRDLLKCATRAKAASTVAGRIRWLKSKISPA